MFKLHDNPQAVGGGRSKKRWNGETKTKAILHIGQLPHQTRGTEGTNISTWHCTSVTKTKDLGKKYSCEDFLGRNIQVFRRQPTLLWSCTFFQCLYSSSSSHTGKLHPNAGVSIETRGQLRCQTY